MADAKLYHARGAYEEIRVVRNFIQTERRWRCGMLEKGRDPEYWRARISDCDRALASLKLIESVFIPNVVQGELLLP